MAKINLVRQKILPVLRDVGRGLEGGLFYATVNHKSSKISKIVSEYDQEIPQSQTADNPVAPPGRAAQPSRDTRKTN